MVTSHDFIVFFHWRRLPSFIRSLFSPRSSLKLQLESRVISGGLSYYEKSMESKGLRAPRWKHSASHRGQARPPTPHRVSPPRIRQSIRLERLQLLSSDLLPHTSRHQYRRQQFRLGCSGTLYRPWHDTSGTRVSRLRKAGKESKRRTVHPRLKTGYGEER